jgi:predicted  nucleic acid-binding Zn-ribbon protein
LLKIRELESELQSQKNQISNVDKNNAQSPNHTKSNAQQIDPIAIVKELEALKNEHTSLLTKLNKLESENSELNSLIENTKKSYENQLGLMSQKNKDLEKQLAESSMHTEALISLV